MLLLFFCLCLRAVPNPVASVPAQGLILGTGSGASRGYGASFIPLELSSGRVLAKKSPQNSSPSAKFLFIIKKT